MFSRLKKLWDKIQDKAIDLIVGVGGAALIGVCITYLKQSIHVPLWLIVLVSLLALVILSLYIKFKWENQLCSPHSQYLQDAMYGVLIEIHYLDNDNIECHPICPICGKKLLLYFDTPEFPCPTVVCPDNNHWEQELDIPYNRYANISHTCNWYEEQSKGLKESVAGHVRTGDWKNSSQRVKKFRKEELKAYKKRLKETAK